MSETRNHLLKLQTYLSKHLYRKPGAQCIRNELLTKCLDGDSDESIIQKHKMCPRCFNVWNEGNFFMKTNSKKCSRKSRSEKSIIMKCLVCNKCSEIQLPAIKRRPSHEHLKTAKVAQRSTENESGDCTVEHLSRERKRRRRRSGNHKIGPVSSNERAKQNSSKKRKRKFKKDLKSNFVVTALNAHSAKKANRKKVALSVLNDLL